ncbi:hypothetical protein [Candidatus Rickettsiella viridis]|nr:hypothetical protein [Candidatus Rickettsiella viridis]
MAIKNHRALKTHIDKVPLVASRKESIGTITRASISFNGKTVRTLTEEMDHANNELILKIGCDEILKGNKNIERERYYREFLGLYLHYDGILGVGVASVKSQLAGRHYVVEGSGVEHKINIYLQDKHLYIEDEFFFRKIIKNQNTQDQETQNVELKVGDYFFHNKTRFKLEVIEQHGVWVPRLVILQSTLDCPDPYFRKMIDERSFLEKLIDFLKAIFRIATHTPVPISTSTFFKSPDNASSSDEEAQNESPALSSCSN